MKLPRSWLLPQATPVLEMLGHQIRIAAHSIDQVCTWADGHQSLSDTIAAVRADRVAERDQRRLLHRRIIEAFSTPLDAEDIYELSQRIGFLQGQLHLLVREADALAIKPDAGLRAMMHVVGSAIQPLEAAIHVLPRAEAADHADEAEAILEKSDKAYRTAIAGLAHTEIRHEMHLRELYRRAEHVTDATARVAHRTWYAVCKSG